MESSALRLHTRDPSEEQGVLSLMSSLAPSISVAHAWLVLSQCAVGKSRQFLV